MWPLALTNSLLPESFNGYPPPLRGNVALWGVGAKRTVRRPPIVVMMRTTAGLAISTLRTTGSLILPPGISPAYASVVFTTHPKRVRQTNPPTSEIRASHRFLLRDLRGKVVLDICSFLSRGNSQEHPLLFLCYVSYHREITLLVNENHIARVKVMGGNYVTCHCAKKPLIRRSTLVGYVPLRPNTSIRDTVEVSLSALFARCHAEFCVMVHSRKVRKLGLDGL